MADLTLGPWHKGIDNVSTDTNLPQGAVSEALNVDIDRNGTLARRAGYRPLRSGPMHSLWSDGGLAYAVVGGELCTVDDADFNTTSLYTLEVDEPLSFDRLNDAVIAGNRRELLQIAADGTVLRLGVQDPGVVQVAPAAYGGLLAGRYAVAASFLRGDQESGLSYGAFATVGDGGGLTITVPQPAENDVTGIRLYRTQANGDVYYRVSDIPLGLTPYLLGSTDLGRQADNQFLERLGGGQIVRYWHGHVLVARGSTLYFSQPMRYGLVNPRTDFVQFPDPITMVESCEAHSVYGALSIVWVGTDRGVAALHGNTPKEWKLRWTSGQAPIAGTGMTIDGALIGGEQSYEGATVALWLAGNGFVLGTAHGALAEIQAKHILLPDEQHGGAGAIAIHRRKIIAVVN